MNTRLIIQVPPAKEKRYKNPQRRAARAWKKGGWPPRPKKRPKT